MAGEKTEKPTGKKLRDAARKGQTFKARDLIVAGMLLAVCAWLTLAWSLAAVADLLRLVVARGFSLPLDRYLALLGRTLLGLTLPVLGLSLATSALPSLLMSRFVPATGALKPDPARLNPVEGFRKLFSLRSLKELVRALIYPLATVAALMLFWRQHGRRIVGLSSGTLDQAARQMVDLFRSLVCLTIGCLLLFLVLDALIEYFLFIKGLKMDKTEVRREYKEQEGNPEIKQQRRQLQLELLSEQVQADIAGSNFMLANPTHIAIGIYLNPAISPAPFVSVLETGQRAQAALAYAQHCGVPVVRDVPLARRLFGTVRRYTLIPLEEVDGIYRVLEWLDQVERAAAGEFRQGAGARCDDAG